MYINKLANHYTSYSGLQHGLRGVSKSVVKARFKVRATPAQASATINVAAGLVWMIDPAQGRELVTLEPL
jgi:hypothetical protein